MGNIDYTYPPTAQEIRDLVKEVEQSDYFSLALQHVFPGTTAAQMRETLASFPYPANVAATRIAPSTLPNAAMLGAASLIDD